MSQRSITCEKSVTFDYPNDGMKIKISRNVYPDECVPR